MENAPLFSLAVPIMPAAASLGTVLLSDAHGGTAPATALFAGSHDAPLLDEAFAKVFDLLLTHSARTTPDTPPGSTAHDTAQIDAKAFADFLAALPPEIAVTFTEAEVDSATLSDIMTRLFYGTPVGHTAARLSESDSPLPPPAAKPTEILDAAPGIPPVFQASVEPQSIARAQALVSTPNNLPEVPLAQGAAPTHRNHPADIMTPATPTLVSTKPAPSSGPSDFPGHLSVGLSTQTARAQILPSEETSAPTGAPRAEPAANTPAQHINTTAVQPAHAAPPVPSTQGVFPSTGMGGAIPTGNAIPPGPPQVPVAATNVSVPSNAFPAPVADERATYRQTTGRTPGQEKAKPPVAPPPANSFTNSARPWPTAATQLVTPSISAPGTDAVHHAPTVQISPSVQAQTLSTMVPTETGASTVHPNTTLRTNPGSPSGPFAQGAPDNTAMPAPIPPAVPPARGSNAGASSISGAAPQSATRHPPSQTGTPPCPRSGGLQATTAPASPTPPHGTPVRIILPQPNGPRGHDPAAPISETDPLSELILSDVARAAGSTTPALTSSSNTSLAQQIARQIALAVPQPGGQPVELRLNPEELGRINLSLLQSDTTITVTILAERGETLELMRRHIALLEGEFRDIGFDDIQFAFGSAGGGNANPDDDGDANSPPAPTFVAADSDPATRPDLAIPLSLTDGLDLRL